MKRVVFIAVFGALVLLATSAAYADNVAIGLGINGGPVIPVTVGSGFATFGPFALAGWTISATGLGTPPADEPVLEGLTVDATAPGGLSTLQVYITEFPVGSPTGPSTLLSGLTSNFILGGIASVTESTFIDNSGVPFALTTPLSSFTFTGPLSVAQSQTFGAGVTLAPGFSETEVFDISASNFGTTSDTITISNAPEPGTLTLFGSGLFGLAGLLRRKLAA